LHFISIHVSPGLKTPSHLIAGGAPAGIKIPTPDFGCLTNNTNINTTTIHGNKSTTPNGIDMLELPFNLRGFLKNANLLEVAGFRAGLEVFSSTEGSSSGVGTRFHTLCTKLIMASMLLFVEEVGGGWRYSD
jgi:hypothetical protein